MDMSTNSIVAGYARVSSKDQNLDRQLLQLQPLVSDERYLFCDKKSGVNFDRENYQAMKNVLRPGDTLVLCSLDRLGRNWEELKKEWQWFQDHKISLRILDMPILNTEQVDDLTNRLISEIVFNLLSYVAQIEREKIKTRQAEGIAAAKLAGKHWGRGSIERPDNWEEITTRWVNGEITAVLAMDKLGLKPTTFYKLAKEDGLTEKKSKNNKAV